MKLQEAIKFYPAFTQEDIALLTNETISTIRSSIKAAGLELQQQPTIPWAREVCLEDLTPERIAKKHHTSLALVRKMLYGSCESSGKPEQSHQHIINYMLANQGKYTQKELADKFGVSQALISKLNPRRRVHGEIKRFSPGEQLEIVKYADNHSILAASLRYNVSRAAIYRWKESLDERRAHKK